jgi:hypothetical protein
VLGTRTCSTTRAWSASGTATGSPRWQQAPGAALVAGSDIIDNTDGLKDRFIPLLGGR